LPTRIETKERRRFRAQTDAGEIVLAIEIEKTTIFRPTSGPEQRVSTILDWRLDDDREVYQDAAGNLRILETDEIIREIS
jgi:hypothetical protein